jgi:hypothetical protein
VVRGGQLGFAAYQVGARVQLEWEGRLGVSVVSDNGLTKLELAFKGQLPHPVVRVTTVGALRSLGYDVVPTRVNRDQGHAVILLPGEPSYEDWSRLISAFDQPEPNPVKA